jgi:hypothetical protein
VAQLTDYLPAVTNGKDIVQPYKSGSIFDGLVDAASTGSDMLSGAAKTRANQAAAARQARKDYLDESDRGAKNATADAVVNLGAPGVASSGTGENALPVTPAEAEQTTAVVAEGDKLGQKAARLQAGVQQGRISSAQYEIMIEQDMRSLMAKYPDSKFVILESMSKYVQDSPGMSEYRAAKAELEREGTAQSAREEEAINVAVTHGGMDPNAPREQLVNRGYQIQTNEFVAGQERDRARFNREMAKDDTEQLKAVNSARDEAMVKYVHGAITPVIQNALDQFNTIVSDKSIPENQRLQAASEFINVYKPKAYELIENNLTIAMNKYGMSPESADKERTRLRQQVDDIATQFSSDNPLNQIVINSKVLQSMKDKFNLDVLDAMPVFQHFKDALGSSESMQALVDTVTADPGLQSVFTKELKGFQGLAQGEQTIRLKNLLAFTTDRNTSLRDYSPQESANIIKDSANLLNNGIYNNAIKGDGNAQGTVLNTLGKVANAAVDLNQGSSTRSLVNSINFLSNNAAFKTLANLNAEHKEFGNLVGDEVRVATGKALMSLMAQGQGDPYFKWSINDKTKRFELVPTGVKPTKMSSGSTGFMKAEAFPTSVDPTPTAESKAKVAAMNKAAAFLMATTPMEDNPALKNATFEEKWRFYTRGEMPESAKPKGENISGAKRISRLQNYWANVKIDWSNVPQVSVEGEIQRTTGQGSGDRSRVMNFKAAQAGFKEVPSNVTTLGGASDFAKQVNAAGVPSSAMGVFQIVGQTLRTFAPRVFGGTDWKNVPFTPENMEKIAKSVFEAHKDSAAKLRSQWEGLTQADAESLVGKTWEEARDLIALRESS